MVRRWAVHPIGPELQYVMERRREGEELDWDVGGSWSLGHCPKEVFKQDLHKPRVFS